MNKCGTVSGGNRDDGFQLVRGWVQVTVPPPFSVLCPERITRSLFHCGSMSASTSVNSLLPTPSPPQSTRRPCSCSSMSTARSMKPTTITSMTPPTPRPSMVASASRRCSCTSRRRRRAARRCSPMRRRSRAGGSGLPARRRGWLSSRSRGMRCCSTGVGGYKVLFVLLRTSAWPCPPG